MEIKGTCWKFGDNVDTDAIIPARYLNTSDEAELALHCMEDADPTFVSKVNPGDIIAAGKNFGCGSSREHAPIAIKGAKVGAVIAESFARIFYRNAFNTGLPILECPEAAAEINEGDAVSINLATGEIHNHTQNRTWRAQPTPPFMRGLIEAGGLVPYVRRQLEGGE
jgi:3-isopropylmalate dehydratase small subunit